MPKRTAEAKIDRYHKKIRKLQKRTNKSYRRIVQHSSDSEGDIIADVSFNEDMINDVPASDANLSPITQGSVVINDNAAPTTESPTTEDSAKVVNLPPDILTALGEPTDDTPKYGEKIDENLASRWQPLLRKGLTKEAKDTLFKNYLVPENCPLLSAPKLNPEISAAINDIARNRDKKLESFQQQIGAGMTALNRGLSLLLKTDMDNTDKIQAIKQLSDSCRIFADLHYMETQLRTKAITPSLEKSFLNIIQDQERDETLFGSKLPDKIKASKAIDRQSSQIKKVGPSPRPSTSSTLPPPARNRFQGNWQPPLRYPSNRGWRGGYKKVSYTPRRAPPAQQAKPASLSHPKSRITHPQ